MFLIVINNDRYNYQHKILNDTPMEKNNKKKKGVYAFIIARRNIPSAIRAPTIAPMTATIPLVMVPTRFMLPKER